MGNTGENTSTMSTAETLRDVEYAHESSELIQLQNQLRELGVAHDIKLPSLVIAGNQSSGKSSVVEAIAGIPLPRKDGTCTRCPTEVRLKRATAHSKATASDEWRCRILLKREFDQDGNKLSQVPTEEEFCTIHKPADVAICVEAAQFALLNPALVQSSKGGLPGVVPTRLDSCLVASSVVQHFLTSGAEYELEFTRNSVVLEVDGAEADLTIVDLPGIIHTHSKQQYIGMIKGMVRESIRPDNVAIVMTLPAIDDLELQEISQMAREADREGKRTIGVITKPDSVPTGTHEKWVATAQNRDPQHTLTLGYYVVKNPDQEQLKSGISFGDARKRETEFFAGHEHWSKLEQDRRGTNNLRKALSDMLIKCMHEELPALRRNAHDRLQAIEAEIRSMPPPVTGDPDHLFQHLIVELVQSLHKQTQGTCVGEKVFIQRMNGHYRTLEKKLRKMMPVFEVKGVFIGLGGDADSAAAAVRAAARMEGHDEEVPEEATTLDSVTELRKAQQARELPGFFPYEVVENLIASFQYRWEDIASECMEACRQDLLKLVQDSLRLRFQQFPNMQPAVLASLTALLDETAETCRERLGNVVKMEACNIFTRNVQYFLKSETDFMTRLKKAYLGAFIVPFAGSQPHVDDLLSKIRTMGIKCDSLESLYLTQRTPVDDELHIMSATLAYFKVAADRALDAIPQHINGYLLQVFEDPLGMHRAVLDVVKADLKEAGWELKDVFAEDERTSNRRRQLQDQRDRLKKAVALLLRPMRPTRG
eukprot:gene22082-29146_t